MAFLSRASDEAGARDGPRKAGQSQLKLVPNDQLPTLSQPKLAKAKSEVRITVNKIKSNAEAEFGYQEIARS